MKIAILYICIGNYSKFWNKFYISSENYFCKEDEKDYIVFTDNKSSIEIHNQKNTKIFQQDDLGWPFTTLYRYHMFSRVKKYLKEYDYLCYFNANTLFIKEIHLQQFFGKKESELVCGIHPGYEFVTKDKYPIERRKNSEAFFVDPNYYFQGCINGGKSKQFMELIEIIKNRIDKDLDKGIVAIWHDESHWNKYINEVINTNNDSLNILDSSYLWPENYSTNNEDMNPKIIMRDKRKYGGHLFLRGMNKKQNNIFSRVIKKLLGIL